MRSISVREIRAALPRLEHLLAEEGELLITRNGRPVARVLPSALEGRIPSRAELRRRLEGESEVLIREDRDACG